MLSMHVSTRRAGAESDSHAIHGPVIRFVFLAADE